MPKDQKRYDDEFKKHAISLVNERGYTHTEAAEALGISLHTLKYWVKAARKNGLAQLSPEAEELRKLRWENNRLKMENDILKKAAAYFAKESL